MKWKKQGLIYAAAGEHWWARSHCLLPTPLLSDGAIRIYFATLDENNFGRVGFADLDIRDPKRVLAVASEPVMDLGDLGTFDDSGVVPSCAIRVGSEVYLYYVGFQRAERVPYMLFTGLAVSASGDGAAFKRFARTPVLDRTPMEPFSRGAPFVLREGGAYRAWYWSCSHWLEGPHGVHYNNVIRHATSCDGIEWKADADVCVKPLNSDEFSLGRPCVVRDGPTYRMWYSIRSHSKGYRVGYAESLDGLAWRRLDSEAGIDVSEEGWDSEMICYPMVVDFGGARHMFYNGNRHGATGFGWAILET
jgi:hypothetical protein